MSEWLIALFFLVALVYSMAGFGGGSSYLALLVLFAAPMALVPPLALICNLTVVSVGSWRFIRDGHFQWRRLFPFLITSIPFAYLGGCVVIDKRVFLFLLSGSLLCAGVNMLFVGRRDDVEASVAPERLWKWGLPAGGLLGGVSGLVGIGGGIFLSPLLHTLRWGNAKRIAGSASVFIFVNSLSGLAGQLTKPMDSALLIEYLALPVAALAGGLLGSFWSSRKFSYVVVQRVTAVLVLYASVRVGLSAF
jgi:uncharacterized membrane protein YfcA